MMTPQEDEVLSLLGKAFIKFRELEVLHPHDTPELALHIHNAQNIVLAREGLRSQRSGAIVYVVMGNDFPDMTFDDPARAQSYCDEKNRQDRAIKWPHRRIFYNVNTVERRS